MRGDRRGRRTGLLKNQLRYLVSGFIFWLPIGILVIVIRYVFGSLEESGKGFLGWFMQDRFLYPGLGTLLWIIVFYLSGLALSKTRVGSYLSRVPLLGMLFRRGGETMTLEKLLTMSPCLFLYSPTCVSYGWILSEQEVKLKDETADFSLVNVYYPNVPTIITGQVYTSRKEAVMRLGNRSREIVDVLLYGLHTPESLDYLPWEDESEEDFKRRAEQFGLMLSLEPAPASPPGPSR